MARLKMCPVCFGRKKYTCHFCKRLANDTPEKEDKHRLRYQWLTELWNKGHKFEMWTFGSEIIDSEVRQLHGEWSANSLQFRTIFSSLLIQESIQGYFLEINGHYVSAEGTWETLPQYAPDRIKICEWYIKSLRRVPQEVVA